MTTEQWLSIVDYARMFNLSDMTVRRRIKSGKLPAKLIDQKYYISIPLGSNAQSFVNEKFGSRVDRINDGSSMRSSVGNKVIRPHPSPSISSQAIMEERPGHSRAQNLEPSCDEHSYIPASLKQPMLKFDSTLVDSRALLAFCEASMRKMADVERRQVEKFKAKLELLEASVLARDQVIQGLKQQLEDMQLLVKILDEKCR